MLACCRHLSAEMSDRKIVEPIFYVLILTEVSRVNQGRRLLDKWYVIWMKGMLQSEDYREER